MKSSKKRVVFIRVDPVVIDRKRALGFISWETVIHAGLLSCEETIRARKAEIQTRKES